MTFLFLQPGDPVVFPDPRGADEDGLLAMGGDLSPRRVLAAYSMGIFPWFDDETLPLWWSPDPRTVIPVDGLHVSRSLGRRIRRGEFRVTWDQAFDRVIRACAELREQGTWIVEDMQQAFLRLHDLGHAHSIEVWYGEQLAGGLYGIHVGGLFAAESKFHRRTDASKLALVAAVRSLAARGVELFDVQFLTPHLGTMGAAEWTRDRYLDELARVRDKQVDLTGLEPSCDPD